MLLWASNEEALHGANPKGYPESCRIEALTGKVFFDGAVSISEVSNTLMEDQCQGFAGTR
jgi:hypothetical protein